MTNENEKKFRRHHYLNIFMLEIMCLLPKNLHTYFHFYQIKSPNKSYIFILCVIRPLKYIRHTNNFSCVKINFN